MKPPATETTRRVDHPAAAMRGLNPRQRQAVEHGEGPLLVVAGAGTGKTHTLVHRVTHHIETGISPERILLLTFTRRAAREMLRR
ncbi:MAG: UvrD-helicase domain-containing protein, partial [Planctomycetales bacterium]